jgi:hypothetical protein
MIYSIWEGDECGITLKPGDGPPTWGQNGGPMDGSVCVLVFEAETWEGACQREYDHYGWGKYVPMDSRDGDQ